MTLLRQDEGALFLRADIDSDLAYHLRQDPEKTEFFHAQLRRWQQEPGLTADREQQIGRLAEKVRFLDAVAAALIALLREIRNNLPDDDPLCTGDSLPFLPR